MNVNDMRNLSASGAVIRARLLQTASRAPYLPNRDRRVSRGDVAMLDTYKGIP
jgi:hypothetical protein